LEMESHLNNSLFNRIGGRTVHNTVLITTLIQSSSTCTPAPRGFSSRSLGPLRSPRLSSTAKRTTTAMCTRHSFPASMVSSGYLLDSYALDATTSLTHTTPPFLSAAPVALLLYDPNGHHAPSNAACRCLSPASSSFSQFLLGAFLANKNHCRARDTPPYGQLSTANLHVTESLEDFNEVRLQFVFPLRPARPFPFVLSF
jgi:hypothetical protein